MLSRIMYCIEERTTGPIDKILIFLNIT